MKIANKFKGLLGLILVTPLAACKAEVLAPAGDVAARQRDLLVISTLLMLLVIIPVMAMTIYFAHKYRAKNQQAEYRPDWDHSTKLEFVIWAIPLLIIVTLGALTWVGTHLLDPYRPLERISADQPVPQDVQPLQVQVVELDRKWLVIYPDQGLAAVNEMAVPVDRPVEFTLTSATVMNSFYIPAMAGMIYAMPGMQTKLHGVFNNAGQYRGIASNYSGWGFSGMHFKAIATDQAGFDDWVAKARAAGGTLDRPRYLELEAPSENVAAMTFAQIDPLLFPRIVNMCVEPGKICMAEMMALDAQGGTGLAGTMNVTQLTYDKHERRGARLPVLGWEPFRVASFCTPEEAALMFADAPRALPRLTDAAPLRGMSMAPPRSIRLLNDDDVTLLAPTDGQAARKF